MNLLINRSLKGCSLRRRFSVSNSLKAQATGGEGSLNVALLTTSKILFKGYASQIDALTTSGAVGILAKHVPSAFVLLPGIMNIYTQGKSLKVAISSGIMAVHEDSTVHIFTGEAEFCENISKELLQQAVTHYNKVLDGSKYDNEKELSKVVADSLNEYGV